MSMSMMHVHTSLCSLQKSHYCQRVLEIVLWAFFAVGELKDKYVSFHYEMSDGVKSFIQEVYMHTVKLSYGCRHGQLSGLLLPAYKHGRGLLAIFF